jgi:hypothetical protein
MDLLEGVEILLKPWVGGGGGAFCNEGGGPFAEKYFLDVDLSDRQ